ALLVGTFVTPSDAGFQIHYPGIRFGVVHRGERVAPGPGEVDRARNRSVHRLGQRDVFVGILDVKLGKGRIARMRQDLVDAATHHHVAAEKEHHRVPAHLPTLRAGPVIGFSTTAATPSAACQASWRATNHSPLSITVWPDMPG